MPPRRRRVRASRSARSIPKAPRHRRRESKVPASRSARARRCIRWSACRPAWCRTCSTRRPTRSRPACSGCSRRSGLAHSRRRALSPTNAGAAGAETNQGSFQYRASLRLAYDLMLSGNDTVTSTGGLGAGATLRGMVNPMGTWSFGVDEDYTRLIRAANFETDAEHQPRHQHARAQPALPPAGTIDQRLPVLQKHHRCVREVDAGLRQPHPAPVRRPPDVAAACRRPSCSPTSRRASTAGSATA